MNEDGERRIKTPVELNDEERAIIREAMRALGIRAMSDYLRVAALAYAKRVS